MNVLRPPQGQIPLVHAGTTERSKSFAARHADVLFSMATRVEQSTAYRAEIESRLAALRRGTADTCILPGLIPIVGETTVQARAKYEELNSLLVVTDKSIRAASEAFGQDLSLHDPESPIETALAAPTGSQCRGHSLPDPPDHGQGSSLDPGCFELYQRHET